MFIISSRTSLSKQLISALTIFSFLAATIGPSNAYDIQASNMYQTDASVLGGRAVMLSLRVPLGIDSRTLMQPTLGLSYGTTWRNSSNLSSRFVPIGEAGFSFDGQPVLRLGSIDFIANLSRRADAEGNDSEAADGGTMSGRAWLAVLTLGGLVGAVALVGGGGKNPPCYYGRLTNPPVPPDTWCNGAPSGP